MNLTTNKNTIFKQMVREDFERRGLSIPILIQKEKTMSITEQQSYTNYIGQTISIGDCVAYPSGRNCTRVNVGVVNRIVTGQHYNGFPFTYVYIQTGDENWNNTVYKKITRRLTSTKRIIKIDINSLDFSEEKNRELFILLTLNKFGGK